MGLQQAAGRYLVFSGEYIWKYTHNAYDFGVFGSTPLTFSIEWNNSKIPAIAGRVSVPNIHGFSALFVFSSVASRFFTPQIGGAGAAPDVIGAFRIDHDERFNQTTHLQYQIGKRGPWLGFNWRYDSGLASRWRGAGLGRQPRGPGRERAYSRSGIPGRPVLRKRARHANHCFAITVPGKPVRVHTRKHFRAGNRK